MKWIRRIAVIWSAPIILYTLILFSGYTWNWLTTGTADPYAVREASLLESLPPILMLMSVIGLLIAWKWERLGSLLAIGFQILALVLLFVERPVIGVPLQALIPFFLSLLITIPGVLFYIHWLRSTQSEGVG